VHIVAMTANAMEGARDVYLEAGMDDYVCKPVQPRTLLGMLTGLAAAKSATANRSDGPLPVLDASNLDDLLDAVLPDKTIEFIDVFLHDAAERLGQIERAVIAGDRDTCRRCAHSLISMAGTFGAVEMSALSRRLEAACNNADVAEIRLLSNRLKVCGHQTAAALSQWIAAHRTAMSSPSA
jgi:HPt (histidine-containing phosphotransfer) domain-containing protein